MTSPSPSDDRDAGVLLEQAGWVRALARRLVADPGEAEDLAQDTLLVALRRGAEAGPPSRAWLAGVLRNLALMRRRTAGRRRRREESAPPTLERFPDAERLAQRLEAQRALSALVSELPEPLRTTVLLRYYEGLDATRIGRRLDVPAATVRTRLKRAVDVLRERLYESHGGRAAWVALFVPLGDAIPLPGPEAPAAPGAGHGVTAAGAAAGGVVMGMAAKVGVALVLAVAIGGAFLWQRDDEGARRSADGPHQVEREKGGGTLRRAREGARAGAADEDTTVAMDAPPPASGEEAAPELQDVHVTVTRADGGSSAGGSVIVCGDGLEPVFATLDAKGHTTLAGSLLERTVIVSVSGMPPVWRAVPPRAAELAVTLPSGASLAGVVRVDGETPREPLRIALSASTTVLPEERFDGATWARLRGEGLGSTTFCATTDKEGGFRFDGLRAEGAAWLLAPTGHVVLSGHGSADGARMSVEVADQAVTFPLERLDRVTGRAVVADPRGAVAGAVVSVTSLRRIGNTVINVNTATTCDGGGRFSVFLPGGDAFDVKVTVAHPDGSGATPVVLPSARARDTEAGDVTLARQRTMKVSVRDASGAPVEGAVGTIPGPKYVTTGPAGPDGLLTVTLAGPRVRVLVSAPGFEERALESAGTDATVVLERAATLVVHVTGPGGGRAGAAMLMLETGAAPFATPEGGVPVTLTATGGAAIGATRTGGDEMLCMVRLDQEDRARISSLRAGQSAKVSLIGPLGEVAAQREVRLVDASEVAVELAFATPAGAVTGCVLDPAGTPVAGAWLRIAAPEPVDSFLRIVQIADASAETGADGRFRFEGMRGGRFALLCGAQGFATRRVDADAAHAKELVVRLERGREVSIHLEDDAGDAIPDARVLLTADRYATFARGMGDDGPWTAGQREAGVYVAADVGRERLEIVVVRGGETRRFPLDADADEAECVWTK